MDVFDELLAYTIKHSLYHDALSTDQTQDRQSYMLDICSDKNARYIQAKRVTWH
jgi:hypothetical protein